MRLLTRYVVREFLQVFVTTLTALTLLLLLWGVGKEAMNQGLGPLQILLVLPYILPEMMRFTLPGTALFAACLVFGRMSSSNEIVAAKSLGINPWALLWPVYVLCFALSLGSVWINELAVTWSRDGVQRVVLNNLEDILYRTLRTQKTYTSKKFSVIVKGVDGRVLKSPIFTIEGSDRSPPVTIRVDEAEFRTDPKARTLTIACRNGTVDVEGEVTMRIADQFERTLALEDAVRSQAGALPPSMMSMPDLKHEAELQTVQIHRLEQELAASAAQQMLVGRWDRLTDESWTKRRDLLRYWKTYVAKLSTEPTRRWANGFSCLCFALVGAPLAVRLKSSEFLRTFGMCFLPILLFYYPLLALGTDMAKRGQAPAYTVWLGNLILSGVSLVLLRRVIRY